MKIREMNANQKALYYMMDELTKDIIGGMENTMQDNLEGSELYEEAKAFLTQGHEQLKAYFYDMLKANREAQKHLKFAGNAFLLERIERRLTKWGY